MLNVHQPRTTEHYHDYEEQAANRRAVIVPKSGTTAEGGRSQQRLSL
jgi:hypothetical protein